MLMQVITYKGLEIGSCPIKIPRSKTFSSEIQKKLVFGGLVEFLFTHLFYGKSHLVKLSVTPFSMHGSPSRLGQPRRL